MTSSPLTRYFELLEQLKEARQNNDEDLEDETTDEMDVVWSRLSHKERSVIDAVVSQAIASDLPGPEYLWQSTPRRGEGK